VAVMRVKIRDGIRGSDGNVYSQEALRQIAAAAGDKTVELRDSKGTRMGCLENLRVNGRFEVHGDFEMGELTPAQVSRLMRSSHPVLVTKSARSIEIDRLRKGTL